MSQDTAEGIVGRVFMSMCVQTTGGKKLSSSYNESLFSVAVRSGGFFCMNE